MIKIINKTPHPVNLVCNDEIRTFKSEGQIRLAVKLVKELPLPDGTPTTRTVFGEPENLPEFKNDTFYIVSQMIKSALPDRKDLLVPAEVVRDKDGRIIGCKSLGR